MTATPQLVESQQGHDLCEAIELAIGRSLPSSLVFTYLEPLEDPASWANQSLDRKFS